MSSHTLGQKHHTYCANHHMCNMYAIKCTIQEIISILYDNYVWYLWDYMHCIQYIRRIIYENSSTLNDVTFTICGTSHNGSITPNPISSWYIHFIWHHTQCYHHKPLCDFTATMPDITLKLCLTLHKMYQVYDKKWR